MDTVQHDGNAALALNLDEDGSFLVYLPSFGLPEGVIAEIEGVLEASEASANIPPDDTSDQSGRRQWFVEPPDRNLGWPGPRRWRRASWKLEGEAAMLPILVIRDAVEAAAAALESILEGGEGQARVVLVEPPGIIPPKEICSLQLAPAPPPAPSTAVPQQPSPRTHAGPRLSEAFNTVLVNRYLDGSAGIKWHADDEVQPPAFRCAGGALLTALLYCCRSGTIARVELILSSHRYR